MTSLYASDMPHHDHGDDQWDEDWPDDDEPDDEEAAQCPECGEPIEAIADKCPSCGYWLSAADRGALWAGERRPAWLRLTACLLLVVIIVAILSLAW